MENGQLDERLRRLVLIAVSLHVQPDDSQIGVVAAGGVVTLSGMVADQARLIAIEAAVRRVPGVRAVVQNIALRLPGAANADDERIARSVLRLIDQACSAQSHGIAVEVRSGWVSLTGRAPWKHHPRNLDMAVRGLPGVQGLSNLLETTTTAPRPSSIDEPEAVPDTAVLPVVAQTACFVWDDGSGQTWCSMAYLELREFERIACGRASEARLNGDDALAHGYDLKARELALQMTGLRTAGHVGRSEARERGAFTDAYAARASKGLTLL
ncbi:hypothetical protein BH10PSE17_BH10PSE17_14270 [soil metagenome]